jgi:hypothetical protein
MTQYDYTKTPVSLDRLTQEIQQSAIVTALDHMTLLGSALSIFFKADLSGGDQTILDSLVSAHNGNPLPQNNIQNVAVQSQPPLFVQSQPPYGSKTILVSGVTKRLFARFTGQQYAVTAGANTLTYTVTYAWAKLLGVEVVNCEALDTADFKVYDTAGGAYSGTPNALLNQFSYSLNLPKDYYQRMAQFDADIYAGMVIQITYTSVSAKTVGLNLFLDEVKT